jgi:hypothetical protein
MHGCIDQFRSRTLCCVGYAVAQLVEALRYKPEGRGFDTYEVVLLMRMNHTGKNLCIFR